MTHVLTRSRKLWKTNDSHSISDQMEFAMFSKMQIKQKFDSLCEDRSSKLRGKFTSESSSILFITRELETMSRHTLIQSQSLFSEKKRRKKLIQTFKMQPLRTLLVQKRFRTMHMKGMKFQSS